MFNSSWNNVNFPTWKAFQSRQELNHSPNPIIPTALLNSEAIWVMTVGLMNMARLSSSSSPYCLGYIYTCDSARRDPRCSWATSCLPQRGINHKSETKPNLTCSFCIFYGTKWKHLHITTLQVPLASGWAFLGRVGEGWHISKVSRLPLDLSGFMTIALILHDLMKTYRSRRIDTSADSLSVASFGLTNV